MTVTDLTQIGLGFSVFIAMVWALIFGYAIGYMRGYKLGLSRASEAFSRTLSQIASYGQSEPHTTNPHREKSG